MARRHKHEDHLNHEAWAIPYGDLITLLLAFCVVMYSMSSVNEGKYRVLADSLSAAFGGPPKSVKPVQFGEKQRGDAPESKVPVARPKAVKLPVVNKPLGENQPPMAERGSAQQRARLTQLAKSVEQAMGELISKDLIVVTRTEQWLEIEIRTDILFSSGSAARLAPSPVPPTRIVVGDVRKIADGALKPSPPTGAGAEAAEIRGIVSRNGEMLTLLDVPVLLEHSQLVG